MDNIILNEFFQIREDDFKNWTICLNNANSQGVYSFDQDRERLMEHISWKKHVGNRTSFRTIDTKYCLQFIRLDKDCKYDQWLFLGAFEVNGFNSFEDGHEVYNLIPLQKYQNYMERLIIRYRKKQGPKQAKIAIENINTLTVVKIIENKFVNTLCEFKGYNEVSLRFTDLKNIIQMHADNWFEVLSNVNAVYVITDTNNGKLYIGSTYGFNGVWQRWSCYVETGGHGGDVKLKSLLKEDEIYKEITNDRTYANKLKFTLLEVFYNRDGNSNFILQREKYWKDILETRRFGYNGN